VRDSGTGGMLIYVYEKGCYRIYDQNMFMGIIKGYITRYNEDILKMACVSETYHQLTTDLVFKNSDELNADENIINFQNGILNLSDMSLTPHSPKNITTIQLPCEWLGYETETPVFDAFMQTLTNGDKAIEKLLLQFMGVCLSNIKGSRMKKALFMVGKGDTGKSQLKSLTEMLLGRGNYIGIDLKEIESRFGTGNIYGKRLAGSSDMSFMSVDELKTFKKCTGGDSLFAEFKGQNGFEFTYKGLLWFCMNKLPKFGGDDGKWVYERIMEVDCNNVIPKEQQDKFLLDKMYVERNGIIYKAITALQRVIQNGYSFSEPSSVTEARLKYQAENNTVISFFNECMTERVNGKITDDCTTSMIYRTYRNWCKENNNGYAKTAQDFRNILAEHLNANYSEMTVRRTKGIYYRNYTLLTIAKEMYEFLA
jgi:P4 family phage/plasmid primase-like protien